jgi:two-component system, OmpR family, alkaline phosphatase synthesis response regulator PhoP
MATILVVEDNENLAFGLSRTLEVEGFQVQVAKDGEEALSCVRDLRPGLIVLDLMLPGMDGFDVLSTLRKEGFETPVLVLSARGEEMDKLLGFRLGADDYVTKPFRVMEVVARIRAIMRRAAKGEDGSRLAVGVITFGDVIVDREARTVRKGEREVSLTPKAFDLLLALMDREGAAWSRLDLLKEVWGHKGAVLTRTVDSHVAELRRKLEDDSSRPRHILTVSKVGYRFQL